MKVEDRIEWICGQVEKDVVHSSGEVSEFLMAQTGELYGLVSDEPLELKKYAENRLNEIIKRSDYQVTVWLYSVLTAIICRPDSMEKFLEYCIEEERFAANTKYFLYNQISTVLFHHIDIQNRYIKLLKWKLLMQAVHGFEEELKEFLIPIPYEQRNQELVFVISQQILGEEHGPTKTAVDRCKILIECLHKKVLLINTAEAMSLNGKIPFFHMIAANYNTKLSEVCAVEWKGTKIPYFQCEENMPDTEVLRMLLQLVQKQKPGLIVEIGSGSMLANLANAMIPVLTIGTVPSDWDVTATRCQTFSGKLMPEDLKLLRQTGKEEKNIIGGVFTSSLQPQRSKITRKELGLPEQKFILIVVGGRLDLEIDSSFMEMLRNALNEGMAAAVVGKFESYGKYIREMPDLAHKIYYLGYTNDILSWMEVCDLYVNPNRRGGGTSSVEALYKGLPVVTLPHGDVSINAGEAFFTQSYETMPQLIQKYKNDPFFYQHMSALAKERAKVLLDTEGEFKRIIQEFEMRI